MARFVFRLAAVLRQRAAVEKLRQADVAALEMQRASGESVITSCQTSLAMLREEMRVMLTPTSICGKAPDTRGARMQAAASLALDARARRHVIQLSGVHQRLAVARRALLAAVKDRRAVELLKERQYADYLYEQRQADSALMDEVAQRSFVMESGSVSGLGSGTRGSLT